MYKKKKKAWQSKTPAQPIYITKNVLNYKSNAEQNCILCEPALVHETKLTFDQYNYN